MNALVRLHVNGNPVRAVVSGGQEKAYACLDLIIGGTTVELFALPSQRTDLDRIAATINEVFASSLIDPGHAMGIYPSLYHADQVADPGYSHGGFTHAGKETPRHRQPHTPPPLVTDSYGQCGDNLDF